MPAEFCEAGELLMECIGELVRRPVARMREAAAAARERHDVACYMFALDADFVIDTTKAGNLARFVNHSCRFPFVALYSHVLVRPSSVYYLSLPQKSLLKILSLAV